MQGDLQQQMGTLRLAEPSEIPDHLELNNGQASQGLSLADPEEASSESSSVTAEDADPSLRDQNLKYSSDDSADALVRYCCASTAQG